MSNGLFEAWVPLGLPSTINFPIQEKESKRYGVTNVFGMLGRPQPLAAIDRVFAVMSLCPQHTFVVDVGDGVRAMKWFNDRRANFHVHAAAAKICGDRWGMMSGDMASTRSSGGTWWPLRNVWLLAKCSTQTEVDLLVPRLLDLPAVNRVLMLDPMNGPIDLSEYLFCDNCRGGRWGSGAIDDPLSSACGGRPWRECRCSQVSWIIMGMDQNNFDRMKFIVKQCKLSGVPCYIRPMPGHVDNPELCMREVLS